MMPWKLFATSLCHAILGYAAMYHLTVFNPMESVIWNFIRKSISRYVNEPSDAVITALWALLNSTITFSYVVGSFIFIPIANRWGRRFCCFFLSPLFLIAGSLTMFAAKYANSFEMLCFGHFLTGFSFALTLLTMACLTEASPAKYKTIVPNIMFLGGSLWISAGGIFGLPQVLGDEQMWQYAVLLPAFPGIIYMIVCLLWIPDSPRYLYLSMGQEQKALEAAKFYYGSELDFEELKKSMDREAELSEKSAPVTVKEIWKDKYLKWCLSVVVVAGFANEAGGGNHIARTYSTEVLHKSMNLTAEKAALASSFLILIPNSLMGIIGIALACKLPHRIHLLSLMIISDFGVVIIFIALFSEEHGQHMPQMAIAGFLVARMGFSTGVGAIAGALPGAICPQRAVTTISMARIFSSGTLAVIETQVYPSLREVFGSYSILMCLLPDIGTFLFLYAYMPETKGKNVDQIMEEFHSDGVSEKTRLLKKPKSK